MAGMRGKCDPSRGGGRGRRVDGRGGRDVLPDCADDGRWRPEQTGADRPTGTAACSRHDRGHTPRRRRRDGCTDGRLSGGGAGPRRRSARGDLRLDNGPEPWHNSSDRLGLSELGAVTRVRLGYNRALTPRLSPLSTLPERSAGGQRRGRGRRRSPWTQRARPQGAWKTAKNAVSHSAHSHLSSPYIKIHGKTGARADQVDECQEFVSFRRPLTRATERGPFRPFGFDDGVRLRTAGALRGPPPENVHHTAGPLTLERAYYPCDACRRGRCPRDQALGLQATSLSPATTRMVGLTAAEVSFAKASELLMVLAGVDVETRQVERTAEALGREVSDDERAVTEQTAPAPAPTVYLGLDGTGIPVRPAEVEGRRGKQPDGSAKTREVKLVTVWTAEGRDKQGRPLRDPRVGQLQRRGRERGQPRHRPAAGRLRATRPSRGSTARLRHRGPPGRRGRRRPLDLEPVGRAVSGAIEIVDIYHAKQHLCDVAKAIYGAGTDLAEQWAKDRHGELDAGRLGALVTALRTQTETTPEARKCIHYVFGNRHRMRYPQFRARGLCISSGVVEAGCKQIGARLKRAGMRWTIAGGNAIIALRCCLLSGRFEDFWERRAANAA